MWINEYCTVTERRDASVSAYRSNPLRRSHLTNSLKPASSPSTMIPHTRTDIHFSAWLMTETTRKRKKTGLSTVHCKNKNPYPRVHSFRIASIFTRICGVCNATLLDRNKACWTLEAAVIRHCDTPEKIKNEEWSNSKSFEPCVYTQCLYIYIYIQWYT